MKQLSFLCSWYREYWDGFSFYLFKPHLGGAADQPQLIGSLRSGHFCVRCWWLPSASGVPRWVVVQETQMWAVLMSHTQLHWPLKDQLAPWSACGKESPEWRGKKGDCNLKSNLISKHLAEQYAFFIFHPSPFACILCSARSILKLSGDGTNAQGLFYGQMLPQLRCSGSKRTKHLEYFKLFV